MTIYAQLPESKYLFPILMSQKSKKINFHIFSILNMYFVIIILILLSTKYT